MAETWKPAPLDYANVWQDLLQEEERKHGVDATTNLRQEKYRACLKSTFRRYLLACYCESIRQARATQWQPLEGFDGAHLVLIERYGWLPSELEALNDTQLALALHHDLHRFTLPHQGWEACKHDLQQHGAHSLGTDHQPAGS